MQDIVRYRKSVKNEAEGKKISSFSAGEVWESPEVCGGILNGCAVNMRHWCRRNREEQHCRNAGQFPWRRKMCITIYGHEAMGNKISKKVLC